MIFWSGIKLQAQDFTPFKDDKIKGGDFANDLIPLIENSSFKDLTQLNAIESSDHLVRFILIQDENFEKHLLVEWNYKGACISQILETDVIGHIQEIKKYNDVFGLNYFIKTKIEKDGHQFLLCHHLQIDSITASFRSMRFHSTREEDYICVDLNEGPNNYIEISENEIRFSEELSNKAKITINRNGVLNYDSLERKMAMVEIHETLSPPMEAQIPDTLYQSKTKLFNEPIATYILHYYDINGDEGNSQITDSYQVIYEFRSQKFISSFYTLNNPETDEKIPYSKFHPEYVILSNGSVLLKTQNLYNAFRSGMCGSCDYWDFSIHEVNKKSSEVVFKAEINLGMKSNSYEILSKGKVVQSSHFRIANDDAELNINDVIWIRNKTWKIRLHEGEETKEVYLNVNPIKGITGVVNANPSTKKKTKRV